ncbi:MAG TPA: TonB-dependent receptor [Opitutaceae bacterium]|nr:TonB-dependent receptor [Opitutaceae bacterium]
MNVCSRPASTVGPSPSLPLPARWLRSLIALGILSLSLSCIHAADTNESEIDDQDLTELSLEELHAVSISAASKRSQPLFETPAAVSVLLPVDVHRAGASSVSDALRLVPGVHVIEQTAGQWHIGVRGGNGVQSTKLLVLVDGRSVYSPFYGSVDWGNADVDIDDLARVEVVRGPGATLWGANAVNGIINVISKDARDTQGGVVSARTGSGEPASGHLRYGAKLNETTWFRVSASGQSTDGSTGSLADSPIEKYSQGKVSWRSDSLVGDRFHFTTQAEESKSRSRVFGEVSTHQTSSVLARLSAHEFLGGEGQIQFYYDSRKDHAGDGTELNAAALPFAINSDTQNFDLDINYHVRLWQRHDVIFGGGARLTDDIVEQSSTLRLEHPELKSWLFNYFLQDEIALTPKQWRLTIGSKLEHHDTIGYAVLPNARLTWLPNNHHTLWVAASRAARAPSRAEREVMLDFANIPASPTTPPVRVELLGNREFDAEINTAYEAGWRWRPTPRFSTDATIYSFNYEHVRSLRSTTLFDPGPPPSIVQRYTITNDASARVNGAEFSWTWRPSDRWELNGGIGHGVANTTGMIDNPLVTSDYALPRWLGHLSSWWQLPRDFEFSATIYGVGENQSANIAGYIRLDAQLLWRPRADLELSIGVQNAADPSHNESITGNLMPNDEVRRNVYGRVQWRF